MVTIRENVPLAPYTYFKIGGPARFFAEALREEELFEALHFARDKNIPFWILGGGSNILIADEGLPGLVVLVRIGGIEFTSLPAGQAGSNLVRVGAGVTMARAVAASVAHELTGFEWAIGIPGTVGGSVRGNAGCFGGEMKDVVESIEVFNVMSFQRKLESSQKKSRSQIKFGMTDCHFDYRESIFKHDPSLIILSATLQLKKGNLEESRKLIAQYAKERIKKQDIGEQCAGCMFKNFTPSNDGVIIPAGWLIDTAGCKGMRVGNAMVSEKHANYFVNCGGATAKDVLALAEQVKKRVREVHGVALNEEIQIYS